MTTHVYFLGDNEFGFNFLIFSIKNKDEKPIPKESSIKVPITLKISLELVYLLELSQNISHLNNVSIIRVLSSIFVTILILIWSKNLNNLKLI